MKIIIDNIIFKWQKSGGISVVWHELIKRMLAKTHPNLYINFIEYKGSNWNLFRKSLNIPSINILYIKSNKLFLLERYLCEYIKQIKGKFIFHSTYYRICSSPNAINIVTVHDFTYELYIKGPKQWFHSWTKKYALRKADYIVCISENTKVDLLRLVNGIDEKKVRVIYNGASDDFYPLKDSIQMPTSFQGNYLIFIGSRAPYKNYKLAVEVASQSNMKLFIVGNKLNEKEKLITENLLGKRYREFGNISNCELNNLYNKAFALIYPSFYEGFGLPIVEAQKAGCPVLALNNSSIKEVIGYTEQLVSIPKASYFCLQINKLKEQNYRNYVIKKGLENAQRFTWDKTYSEYIKLYTEIEETYK